MKERDVLGFASAAFIKLEGDVAQVREPLKAESEHNYRRDDE
jgi:hypothetical protein